MEVIKENHSILGLKVLRRRTVRFITAGPRELLAKQFRATLRSSNWSARESMPEVNNIGIKRGGGVRWASTCTQAVKSVREERVIYRSRRRVQWKALINPSLET